jgi:putative zinc-binding metallo-peptidase
MATEAPVREAPFREGREVRETESSTPIRELGLRIEGTPLAAAAEELRAEVERLGLSVRPRFYLSTEWGVVFGTVAIGMPFYLAKPELAELHETRTGHLEGADPRELLRYLRHEMGHVVNYAYRLYERPDWVERFGSITQPYREEYRPRPFSRKYVQHLPGWYAQMHPDEDWAETFAVWMTPGLDWRREYASWPGALAKLELCDAIMTELKERPPLETKEELDEEVGSIGYSVSDYYGVDPAEKGELAPGLDGALATLFETSAESMSERRSAAALLRRLARSLPAEVYRWTGHFPEQTRALLLQMAKRAEALGCTYDVASEARRERDAAIIVTALAMSHVQTGSYAPT